MISKEISEKILFVGTDPSGKGGIATLLNSYSIIFSPFNMIVSHKFANILVQIGLAVFAYLKFLYFLIWKDISIVHIHTASYRAFYRESFFVLISKLFRKKIILHIHGGEFEVFYRRHPDYILYICSKVDCLVAVSSYFLYLFHRYNLNRNIKILYNIVDYPYLNKKKISGNKVRILYLGAIDENKGIFEVLECIAKNKEKFEHIISLDIAGIGNDKYLKFLIEQNELQDFVTYHGWLCKEDKHKLLSESDIYIQPSYFESLGIAIIEAMSYGMPVIATRTGGIPDLIEDGFNGFLISVGDMDSLMEYLIYFIKNPDKRRWMGENGKEKSKLFFTEAIELEMLKLYKSLI